MKVVVINMEKSKDRWNRISGELKGFGLDYERFPAIEGKKLSDEEIAQKTTFIARTFLCTHASVGCALSHVSVWKNFIDSGEEFICIVEDDATFNEKFPQLLKDIPEIFKDTDFDILQLYGELITNGDVKYVNNYYKIVKPKFGLSFCCYILNRKGAIKLYELFGDRVSYTIDFHIALLNSQGKINQLLLSDPEMVKPSLEISTINNLNMGGVINKIIDSTPLKQYKKYTNSNVLNICLKYSITPYLVFLITILTISLLKKWYLLSIIIGLEIIMLLNDL